MFDSPSQPFAYLIQMSRCWLFQYLQNHSCSETHRIESHSGRLVESSTAPVEQLDTRSILAKGWAYLVLVELQTHPTDQIGL